MKNHLTRISTLTVLLTTPLLTLSAQEGPRPGPGEMLKRADTDGDGKISKDEFIKSRTAEIDEQFARMDSNGDGFVEAKEVESIVEKMRAGGGDRSRGGPPPAGGDGFRPAPPAGERDGARPEGGRPEGGPRDGEGERRGPPEGGFQRGAGGPPAEMLEQIFGRMDADESGSLSKQEFVAGMGKMREMMQQRGGEGMREGLREGMMRRPEGGPPGGGEGFRRPPQQGGGDSNKPKRPALEEGA